jgi:hypothetical protein
VYLNLLDYWSMRRGSDTPFRASDILQQEERDV